MTSITLIALCISLCLIRCAGPLVCSPYPVTRFGLRRPDARQSVMRWPFAADDHATAAHLFPLCLSCHQHFDPAL